MQPGSEEKRKLAWGPQGFEKQQNPTYKSPLEEAGWLPRGDLVFPRF